MRTKRPSWILVISVLAGAVVGGAAALKARNEPAPSASLCLGPPREIATADLVPSHDARYQAIEGLAYGRGRFVAVGESIGLDGFPGPAVWVDDGLGWERLEGSAVPPLPHTTLQAVAWGAGRWIVVGYKDGYHDEPVPLSVLESEDGTEWRPATSELLGNKRSVLEAVAWGDDRWTIAGTTGFQGLTTTWGSEDASSWDRSAPHTPAGYRLNEVLKDLDYDGRWIALGGFGRYFREGVEAATWTSDDGRHWTHLASPIAKNEEFEGIGVAAGQLLAVGKDTVYQLDATRQWAPVAEVSHFGPGHVFLEDVASDGRSVVVGGVIGPALEGLPAFRPGPRSRAQAAMWEMELRPCASTTSASPMSFRSPPR